MNSQAQSFELAPRYLLAQLIPLSDRSEAGLYLPHGAKKAAKATNQWKVLNPGKIPDIAAGDIVIPEKQTPITLDDKSHSLIFDEWIFGVISMQDKSTSQVERLKLAPKFILAKLIKTDEVVGGLHVPQKATSFWEVVRSNVGLEQFPDLAPGDSIAPEKHVPVVLDHASYAMVHENWILGRIR